ncbi:hypothetical protein OKW24_003189 [Peribacillus simplex]|nr:hypothetical protein [Peribacillus simplex]
MTKYSLETKLAAVHFFIEGHEPFKNVAQKDEVSKTKRIESCKIQDPILSSCLKYFV